MPQSCNDCGQEEGYVESERVTNGEDNSCRESNAIQGSILELCSGHLVSITEATLLYKV